MAMLSLPGTRPRRQGIRLGYTLGLLVMLGTATTLVVAAQHPAGSATRLQTPVPAPQIYVIEESAPTDPFPGYGPAEPAPPTLGPGTGAATRVPGATSALPTSAPAGGGGGTTVDAHRPDLPEAGEERMRRILLWSGIGGLVVSVTGMSIAAAHRRRW
jgi:hypothetical protein